MRIEQWIFYENFPVFGQTEIFQWIEFLRRRLNQIQGNWAEMF